ncbi:helix-turn-helix domain-containing protein [Pedobacter sp. P26]|uniref:helix-turn-helix domain-containing protein n=1 Tax=Pedobacter sp. P26 TaxID=3423956 RepID=UPI003D664208
MRINPAVRWIKPKSPEENGFGSEVYICSEGKELRCASSGNQFGGQFGPKQRGHFHRNTQQHLADEMGMSRSVLYKKVQQLTNYAVADLIKEVRLKRAAQLLAETSSTLTKSLS